MLRKYQDFKFYSILYGEYQIGKTIVIFSCNHCEKNSGIFFVAICNNVWVSVPILVFESRLV